MIKAMFFPVRRTQKEADQSPSLQLFLIVEQDAAVEWGSRADSSALQPH